jgi:sugar phosphate isomerase/epimerase
MKYFISTINFSPETKEKISDILPRMVNKGIKNIEISSLHPYEEGFEHLIEYSHKHGLNLLLHNYAPPARESFLLNLCSKNDFMRNRASNFIKDRIEFTKKLNMDYFSFHAGFRVNYMKGVHEYKTRISDEQAMKLFTKELQEIIAFAEEKKVHIGIENHVAIIENKDNLILYGINNWKKIFEIIDSKYFHLHLDLGHLKISAAEHNFNRDEFIELFGDKVIGMHIHDNTGVKIDCHAPFSNDFWFGREQIRYLKNLKYAILETKTFGNMPLIDQMINYIKKADKK